MVRKSIQQELAPRGSLQRSSLPAANAVKLDVILGSDRDVAYCLRLAQKRYKNHRPCLVQINSQDLDWQCSPVFDRGDFVLVNDQCLVEANRIYFLNHLHLVSYQHGALWIKKNSQSSTDITGSLRALMLKETINLGDLVLLKNAQCKSNIINIPQNVEHIWREGDLKETKPFHPKAISMSRSEIVSRLCDGIRDEPLDTLLPIDISRREPALIEENLLRYLHQYSEIDYRHFKQSWLVQHVHQRCATLGLESVVDYVDYCQDNEGEWYYLEQSMFPQTVQPDLFQHTFAQFSHIIQHNILEDLFSQNPGLRLWVPDCGLGEVAYSLALAWHLAGTKVPIKIFSTDIKNERVEKAAFGLHTSCLEQVKDVKGVDSLRGRKKDDFYSLPELRKNITFTCHNLISSPNFSQLHLIHCHQLLNSYKESSRNQILAAINQSLLDGGILWLSNHNLENCEEIGFEHLAEFPGIYRKVRSTTIQFDTSRAPSLQTNKRKFYAPPLSQLLSYHKRRSRYSEYHGALDLLIDRHLPPGLLINQQGNLVHIIGNVSSYMESVHEGHFSVHIKKLLKPDLVNKLSPAIDRLLHEGRELQLTLPWQNQDKKIQLTVSFEQLHTNDSEDIYAAIFFEKQTLRELQRHTDHYSLIEPHLRYIEKLETDLSQLRENEQDFLGNQEQEITDLTNLISELTAAKDQTDQLNINLTRELETLRLGYDYCRQALSYTGSMAPGGLQPAIAILDSNFNLRYYNANMSDYFVDQDCELETYFLPLAQQLGGRNLVNTIKACAATKTAHSVRLPGLISVNVQALPDDEILITLFQTPLPSKDKPRSHPANSDV